MGASTKVAFSYGQRLMEKLNNQLLDQEVEIPGELVLHVQE